MVLRQEKNKTLFQSCHILHKQGKYYIVHFKELFALDGKDTNISENDIARRNTIANLLSDWGLINVVGKSVVEVLHHYHRLRSFRLKKKTNGHLKLNTILEKRKKGNNMKPGIALMEAARAQAEGEVAVHKANILVYQTMPAGIGEHSDITEAVIAELDKLAR